MRMHMYMHSTPGAIVEGLSARTRPRGTTAALAAAVSLVVPLQKRRRPRHTPASRLQSRLGARRPLATTSGGGWHGRGAEGVGVGVVVVVVVVIVGMQLLDSGRCDGGHTASLATFA